MCFTSLPLHLDFWLAPGDYISDVLGSWEMKYPQKVVDSKSKKNDVDPDLEINGGKIIFKKRAFKNPSETVSEIAECNLIYAQNALDVLSDKIDLSISKAAELAALNVRILFSTKKNIQEIMFGLLNPNN